MSFIEVFFVGVLSLPSSSLLSGEYFSFLFFLKMDGLQGKDMDMAGERRAVTDKETDTRQRDGKRRMDYNKRIYSKEATVIIDMAEQSDARAEDIIKAVNERIGGGKILAVRPRQGKEYEITLTNREACDGLDKGLIIKGKLRDSKTENKGVCGFFYTFASLH